MILHTLNQPPSNTACLESALSAMAEGDTLLLIEDGVYWALPAYSARLSSISGNLLALQPDLAARGLDCDGVEQVDDAGFVALCVSHDKVVSWF